MSITGYTKAGADAAIAAAITGQKGVANGVATLDGTGRVPASQLTLDALEYKGTWNASTNTPTLANGTGNAGDLYKVSVAGSHDFGAGSITFSASDELIYDGSLWQRVAAAAQDADVAAIIGNPSSATTTALKGTYVANPSGSLADYAVGTKLASGTNNFAWTTKEELVARALGWVVATDARWGAKGDGTTDDRVAVNAAAAAASSANTRLWFPPGTYVMSSSGTTNACIDLTGPIPEICGAGNGSVLKLINNNPGPSGAGYGASTGNYYAMLSGHGNDISGTHVHHLTFNGNNSNAGNTVQDASFVGPSGQTPRTAIAWTKGARVRVTDCRFTDFDSMWLITTSGAVAGTISDTVIERNTADNIGSTVTHDHSSIYIDSDGMVVVNNVLRTKGTGYSGTRTGIETHGPGQVVAHNRVYGYQNGTFTCSNSTSVGTTSVLSGCVHDNFFSGVGIGIQLRAYAQTGPYAIADFSCHDNVVINDFGTWHNLATQQYGSSGINLTSSDVTPIRDVVIRNNQIRMTNFTSGAAADNQSAGIYWQRTSGTPIDYNIVIDGNVIDGAGANGIYFSGSPSGTQRLSISDNRVIDPGQAVSGGALGAASAVGIYVNGIVTDGSFHRNKWIDDQGTHTMGAGLQVVGPTGSARLSAYDNEIYVADGTFGTSVSYIVAPTTSGVGIDMRGTIPVLTGSYVTGNFAAGSTFRALNNGNIYVQPSAGGVGASWRLAIKSDAKGSVAAQAGAGTSPPTPTWVGRDVAGTLSWGTGTSPAAGNQVKATFASGNVGNVAATFAPRNAATAALQPYLVVTATDVTVAFGVAPAASQAAGTYVVDFIVEYVA